MNHTEWWECEKPATFLQNQQVVVKCVFVIVFALHQLHLSSEITNHWVVVLHAFQMLSQTITSSTQTPPKACEFAHFCNELLNLFDSLSLLVGNSHKSVQINVKSFNVH